MTPSQQKSVEDSIEYATHKHVHRYMSQSLNECMKEACAVDFKCGYREGYSSRDAEVEGLKEKLGVAEKALEHICHPETPKCCLNEFHADNLENHYHDIADEALTQMREG